MKHDETDRLKGVAPLYGSRELAGANEAYHVHLRDTLIPEAGGRSALEIGCGKGLWTAILGSRYEQLDVVDASKDLLAAAARAHRGSAKLATHDMLAEDFLVRETRCFQHVYLTFLLEHVEDPVGLLRLVRDRCEQDGRLYVAVPNADSIHRVLAVRAGLIASTTELSDNDHKVGHRRVYTRQRLHEHIVCGGFEVEREVPVGLKPLTLAQLEGLPESVIHALCVSGDLVDAHAAYWAVVARPVSKRA